jgi:hypothetical protein
VPHRVHEIEVVRVQRFKKGSGRRCAFLSCS